MFATTMRLSIPLIALAAGCHPARDAGAAGPKAAAPTARTRSGQRENAFAADDRQLVTSEAFPWSTVGRLSNGCTATLISKRLILTAAHCIFDPRGGWTANSYDFSPNLVGGQSRDSAHASFIWYGTHTPLSDDDEASVTNDWAIMLLDRDLGSQYNWLGVLDYTAQPGDAITLTGYSADVDAGATATTHVDCSVRGYWHGQLAHDCDLTRGASGGPIWSTAWGEPAIVGVQSIEARDGGEDSLHLAAYDGTHPNGAVAASRFYPTLVELVGKY